jgi:hypothetical protein
VIVCVRTVLVPPEWSARYLAWIAAGRKIRQRHGNLAELVCEPADPRGAMVTSTCPGSPSTGRQHQTTHRRRTHVKWITRARPRTDRIACPWLIRRFIDPDAEIIYVPADEVLATAQTEGGHSFDAPGATFTHAPAPDGASERCTFEALIAEHGLDDPALARLARIVHAADISSDLHTDPLGAGLLAIGVGGLDVEADDQVLLQRATFVYDALYAWCTRDVARP